METMRFVIVCLCLLAVCVYGQLESSTSSEPVSQTCLGCICEASSGCNTTLGCNGDVCGPFKITWAYWADGGKPTLNDEGNNARDAYSNCVIDAYCAAKAVQGYMSRFGQDCNGDGRVDCDDFARIHRHGGYGCSRPLDYSFENPLRLCLNTYSNLQ